MTQNGYMLIKLLKTVNIYLWAQTREELEEELNYLTLQGKRGFMIVPYYKDGTKAFLRVDDKLLRIN